MWSERTFSLSPSTSDNGVVAVFSLNVWMLNISTLFQVSVLTSIFTSLNVFAQFGPKHKVRMLSWQDMSKTFFGNWLLCPLKQLDSLVFLPLTSLSNLSCLPLFATVSLLPMIFIFFGLYPSLKLFWFFTWSQFEILFVCVTFF